MNILFMTAYFPPEIGSASHLFYDLSQSLGRKGHKITVVTTFPRKHAANVLKTRRYKKFFFLSEYVDCVHVIRIAELPTFMNSVFSRGLEHFILPTVLLLGGLISKKQDIIVVYSPPLPLGLSAFILSKIKNIPFIVSVQDLHPKALVDLGLLKNHIVIRMFEVMEEFIYHKANFLTVHSEGNRKYVISKGVSPDKVFVIPNWPDTLNAYPLERLDGFRKKNSLGEKFVVTYAGIFSHSQDLETVIDCAFLLREQEDILFLLVGDGPQKKRLVNKANALNLKNLRFLPFQPRGNYHITLKSSNVCLVSLRKSRVKTPVVPRKLQDIMASGRTVIANVPLNGDVPKIIEKAKCGLSVESENPKELAQAILQLYRDPSLREELGRNGKQYAEKHFSLSVCTRKYERLLVKACQKR